MTETGLLLDVADLVVRFRGRRGKQVTALSGVDLTIREGETVGLVGESGSGKSTLGNAVLGLAPVASGTITFAGEDISHARNRQRRRLSRDLQAVFQNPYGSLNPTRTIGSTLAEPMHEQGRFGRAEIQRRIREVLDQVGMPADSAQRYPSEFSGGQRQRIAIARALVLSPRLIICDEPVSALDLSIQAQVLNLLGDLKRELGVSLLFISHDLAVVRYIADSIVVLKHGEIVERGPAAQVYDNPQAEYTQRLLAAAPAPVTHVPFESR
ncbi:ABC transporter ATP-binding protein [Homoserinibacter sp. GY 40078]|uniref:ABC transporter ATP-binding protein n=1 Tax=Homoserinibacter sp. GY 40078 TaxID=2603275 RepID=UPI0011CCD2DF|nr:ATP-binding cassette domain-containing protein [Homoserinibacter sp. GY 40078]TXK19308.1 ABC transporter ATP-binding protein [Homoserinibacter sp. GY 40078]